MDLVVTFLIVAFAAAIVLRRTWRLFHGGKPGCAGGCGSCPANAARAPDKSLVALDLSLKRPA